MAIVTPIPGPRLRPAGSSERVARGQRFDRAYWIAHCEGFRVDTRGGRLGYVEEVRDGPVPTLAIRAGTLGRRLWLISAAEVAFIVPRARRIWLKSPVSIDGVEPLRRSA